MPPSDNTTAHPSTAYDAQVRNTIPYYETFHQETINLLMARPQPPRRWLDTGCGTGTLVERAAACFPETHFVLADPAPAMLAEAQHKLAALPTARIHVLEAAGTQEIPASYYGTFDVVTAIQAHHYLSREERRRATTACCELLAPGGIYITFENIRPFTAEGIALGKAYWGQFQRSRGKSPAVVENHLQRFGVEYFPIPIDEHLALLRESGFTVVEMLWYSYLQAGFYAIK